jgi:hypothetical protein
VLAMMVASAAVGSSAAPAAAAGACAQDGAAVLCVTTVAQDSLAITYHVTQTDGPGRYTFYYVDTSTGVVSPTQAIGPLDYQEVAMGTVFARLNRCYDVHLDGTAGTSVVITQVCG